MRARSPWWVLLLLLSLAGCGGQYGGTAVSWTGPIMGTSYRVVAVPDAGSALDRERLGAGIVAVMEQVNQQMSTYLPDSELSRFNRHRDSDWFPVSPDLAQVVTFALDVSRRSDGAFDVTVGPLVNLWGFGPGPRQDRVPTQELIEQTRARVGYGLLESRSDPPGLRKARADIYVDLSAIAKGYAVDRVSVYLEGEGISNYLVDIGGDLRAQGRNEGGRYWTIGIEKPLPGERGVHRVVSLQDRALATSGDYRNYFERDGRRYSHTIDPRTGAPVTHSLVSVSVAARTAMEADALATGLLVLGPARAHSLAQKLGVGAYLIIKQEHGFSTKYTPKFERMMVKHD